MANIKDLFNGKKSDKILENASQNSVGSSVESPSYLRSNVKDKNLFIPHVDFTSASNFAFYGSAEKYYEDAFKYIQNEYPYDGSKKEKIEWQLSGTYFDRYIFNNVYPKTTGYVNLGQSYSFNAKKTKGYDSSTKDEWIYFKGNNTNISLNSVTNPKLTTQFDLLNVYNTSSYGLSSLQLEGSGGVSVEFWLNKQSFNSSNESRRQVILDIWNSGTYGTSGYGRLRVEISGTEVGNKLHPNFQVELLSGTSGFSSDYTTEASPTITLSGSTLTGSWNHYALTFANTGSQMVGRLYTNGVLSYTHAAGTSIGTVTGTMIGQIGSLVTTVSGAAGINRGDGKLSASLDEFRFWKTKRTSKQVSQNWFTQVNGATEDDVTYATSGSTKYDYTNPVDLGLYYKFNEGIISTSSVNSQDSVILDYAGRVTNGAWTGYTVTSRNTGSAIVSASASPFEIEDPILYSDHPRVSSIEQDKKYEGKFHDVKNNSSLYGSIPDWITSDDQTKSNSALRNLTQIMSSYFDNAYLQIKSLPELKNKNYVSSSDKPYPFVGRFLNGSGFITSEIYSKATDLEYLDSRNDSKVFETKVNELKNLIYQNIYNNLVYVYKSKGTMNSFRNLIRCFGVDNELININLYGDQVTYDILDNYENVVVRKRYANFHDENNLNAVVFQQTASSNAYSRGYLSSSSEMQYRGNTYEIEAIFPKDTPKGEPGYFGEAMVTASIYGCHTSGAAGSTAWGTPDYGQFQVQSVRPDKRRSAAYFQLTCSNDGAGVIPKITSSVFQDVYEDTKWNFAVRIKPKKYPLAAGVTGSDIGQYDVEFSGYNYVLDVLNNSFHVTSSISSADAQNFLKAEKRFFVGAHRTNTTGTVLQQSNIEASSLMVWADYLTSSVLQAHAKDATNFGSSNPYRDAYITEFGTSLGSKDVKSIPQLETLLLKWDFETVTSSDAGGSFIVQDTSIASSGSNNYTGRWGWLGPIGQYQHTGKGFGFRTNYTGSIKRNYVNTLKQNPPEVVSSEDMISLIDDQQNQLFTRDSRPENYFYAFEKSMYATISKEMINIFGTIVDFNNLIGQPVNRYRLEYKDMQKLKELYFERVQNDVDLDKFVEYFKWLDSALSVMLQQLVPSSAKFSENLRTMVESHILERNKYWSKFPTLEMKNTDPEAGLFGINELLYSGKRGTAPIPNTSTNNNCLWWKDRAERDEVITSGDENVDSNRETIKLSNDFRSGSGPTLAVSRASTDTTTTYEGQTFAIRNFTKPYRLIADESPTLHGGSNFDRNKTVEYTHQTLTFSSSAQLTINASSIPAEKECDDVIVPNAKEKLDAKIINSKDRNGYLSGKDDIFAPFTLFSSSINSGYLSGVSSGFRSNTEINNYHDDVYGDDKGIPAQGPFTERHVGGRQHRHINVNSASSDTTLTRPEAWNLDLNSNTLTISTRTIHQPRATMIRDAYAKRPLNIANINWGTASAVAGNYRFDYEILQTSGRKINNRFFVKNQGFEPTASDTGIFSGAIDYALPRFDLTGANKSIFVERFNAPGGPEVSPRGAMDVNSEEFSVYNGLNYRNLVVRTALDGWYTEHCGQYGIDPTGSQGDGTLPSEHTVNSSGYDQVIAAYHKTNRNRYVVAGLSNGFNGSPSCSFNYDNWYIQHPIPRSPYQYMWITSSLSKSSNCDILRFAGSHDGYGLVPFTVPSGTTSITQSGPTFTSATCWEPIPIDYECFPPGGVNHAQYAFIHKPLTVNPEFYKYKLNYSTPNAFDFINVTQSGDVDRGITLEKNTGTAAWNGAAATRDRVMEGGWVEFEVAQTDAFLMVGLNRFPENAISFTDFEFGFEVVPESFRSALPVGDPRFAYRIFEDGDDKDAEVFSFLGIRELKAAIGDVLRIRIEYGNVLYEYKPRNENEFKLLYKSEKVITGRTFVDVSIYTVGAKVKNLVVNAGENTFTPGSGFLSASDTAPTIHGHTRNINGPYQHPSWKQIRTGETPVARYHKNNNILSVMSPARRVNLPNGSGSNLPATYFNSRTDSIKNFIEPPVTFKYKPIDSYVINAGTLRHTYGNNKCLFSQRNLPISLGGEGSISDFLNAPNEKKDLQIYDKLKNNQDYQTSLGFFTYKENVFPRGVNATLARTRSRTNYSETAYLTGGNNPPTASLSITDNGIDRSPGIRRTFWKNDRLKRNRYSVPINGYYPRFTTTISNSLSNQDGFARSVWSFGEEPIVYKPPHLVQQTDDFLLRLSASSEISSTHVGCDGLETTIVITSSNDGMDTGELNSFNCERMTGFFGGATGSGVNSSLTRNCYQRRFFINPSASAYYYTMPYYGRELYKTGTDGSAVSYSSVYGPYNAASSSIIDEILTDFNKGMKWRTHTDSGRNPWYDSYDAYFENIKGLSKEYSIVPEFRISDHIKFYVNDKSGDFRTKNDKFLSLNGAEITSSAFEYQLSGRSRNFRKQFFKEYSFSDFQKYFATFSQDYDNKRIALKCKTVKKLLPYKGFYPAERSLQLVSLLSESLSSFLTGGAVSASTTTVQNTSSAGAKQLALQSLLQPWFAPGIMYNTIKSGIAVDWPIYTGSFDGVNVDAYTGFKYLTKKPNKRVPFWSLLNPLQEIPQASENTSEGKLMLLGPSYYISELDRADPRTPFAEFRNRPDNQVMDLYSSAMNNYLAEIPNFFLQKDRGESLKSIRSKKAGDIVVDPGKVYVMDAFLEKTNTAPNNELIMIQDYYNGYVSSSFPFFASGTYPNFSTETPSEDYYLGTTWGHRQAGGGVTGSYNGKYFGPKFDCNAATYDTGSTGWAAGQVPFRDGDPAFAPCTPPYFYGKCKVRLIFTASVEDVQGRGSNFGGFNWRRALQRITMSFKPSDDPRRSAWTKYSTTDDAGKRNTYTGSVSFQNMMDLTSSLNMQGIYVEDSSDRDLDRWYISPHMETPVLDFSCSQRPEPGYGRGMWSGYGKIPNNNKGLFFGIEKASDADLNNDNVEDMRSWFEQTEPQRQRVGQLASEKEIFEAIVAIPFSNNPVINASGYATTVENAIMDKNFFTMGGVDKVSSRNLFDNPDPNTEVERLKQMMSKYVFPPELDFNKNRDIEPFVMYVMEFSHKLSPEELSDIWQGVMPDIAMVPELEEKEVSHEMNSNEFFGAKPLPNRTGSQIRWMVFKVKQRAYNNYWASTPTGQPGTSFETLRENLERRSKKFENPIGYEGYSYNWPYDYFSLVELAQIEAGNSFTPYQPSQPSDTVTDPAEYNEITIASREGRLQTNDSNNYQGAGSPGTSGGAFTRQNAVQRLGNQQRRRGEARTVTRENNSPGTAAEFSTPGGGIDDV